MELTKNTIFSIFIILLFIGSMVAVAVSFGRTRDDTPSEPNIEDLPEEQYLVELDAKVAEIFPNFFIVAETNVFDVSTIETRLREIDGITNVKVSFMSQENQIMALISVTYNTDKKEEVYSEINNLDIFEAVDIFKNSLLEVPKEIDFVHETTEEIKEYYHPTGKIEAYISYNTEKDDEIAVSAVGIFKGNVLLYFVGQEMQNYSGSQQYIMDTKTYSIESWNNEIILIAEADITKNINENNLKTQFSEEEVQVYVVDHLEIITDYNLTEIKEELLRLQEKEYIEQMDITEKIIIYFKEDVTAEQYYEAKEGISLLIEEYEITKIPKRIINIKFEKEDINVEEVTQKIESYNAQIKELVKSANILLDDLVFNGKEYTYESNTTLTYLDYPEDTNRTEFLFSVMGLVIREEILYIAIEKMDLEPTPIEYTESDNDIEDNNQEEEN